MKNGQDSSELDTSPISALDLERVGARVRSGASPADRRDDILGRYLNVPNRMLILFSSEDEVIADYILQHWAALDGLSGEACDIYPSLLQMSGDEDVYSYLRSLKYIPGAEAVDVRNLPLIIIWSDVAYSVISIERFSRSFVGLRCLFRRIFSFLHANGTLREEQAGMLRKELVEAAFEIGESRLEMTVFVDRRIDMSTTTTNRAGDGSIILSGEAKAGDITLQQSWQRQSINMPRLAVELGRLRQQMKTESLEPDHDIAVGQIAAAEAAAKRGDEQGTISALRNAGEWALGVAEKIGVDVAAQAIKTALGV